MTALSSGWASSSHRAVRAARDPAQRLALAIGPVRSIIRVVDSHVPAMSVDWASYTQDEKGRPMSKSLTDFKGGRIAVNPLPMMDTKLDIGDAIDIEAGFGLHEASHAEESRDRYGDLIDKVHSRVGTRQTVQEVPAFHPFRVAIWLWNLVEDVRIEAVTGRKWPGSRPYFAKVLNWMWSQHPIEMEDFASPKVEDRMKIVFVACRFADRLGLLAANNDLMTEVEWWQAWQADYLAARTDVRETIRRGLEHLAQDEETAHEMAEMEQAEKDEIKRGEKVRAQLERLLKEGIGSMPVCITEDGDVVPLDPALAEAVDKLVREQLRSEKPLFVAPGAAVDEVRITRPEETAASRRAFVGRPTPLVEAMRAALVFRASRPEFDLKLQKSGHLDEQELWRLSTDDVRIFSEHVIEHREDVALGLLVDMSGSMAGPHLRTAQRLAQTALWATVDDEGIEARVWAHTADVMGDGGSDVYRIWEPGDPMSRLGLISTLPHANNADGFAIAHCVNAMKEVPRPQKELIVFSDGYPHATGYGGSPAQRHMRQVCDWAERQGVLVFQVAIDDELRAADQERMFGPGRWLAYSTDARLPRDLTRLLARLTA